jgi:transposase
LWERATIILELAAGTAKQEIAKRLGLARQTVLRWEQRFLERGMDGLNDVPRSGRPATIGPEKIAQIIQKTRRRCRRLLPIPASGAHGVWLKRRK